MPAVTALLEGDCPRCGLQDATFHVSSASTYISEDSAKSIIEAFCTCRRCHKSTILNLKQIGGIPIDQFKGQYINHAYVITAVVSIFPDARKCPGFVPAEVLSVFDEAAKCLVTGCYDASGAMSRKVLDLATRSLLPKQPEDEDQTSPDWIAWKIRKDLRLRLNLLFDRSILPSHLKELVSCVHESGNDAAHSDVSLSKLDAMDLQDFTVVVLEHIYSRPGQVAENIARRDARRDPSASV